MARIRTIKPDFFRHEGLQDLELAHPGAYPMLTFAGLWTLCDKVGRFRWQPRQIKLDVLPFLSFDMAETLALLEDAGFVRRYVVDEHEYGYVPTFLDHQRISGKEAQEPARFPEPGEFVPVKRKGSNREATGKQPRRQEREREMEREGSGVLTHSSADADAPALSLTDGVQIWNDAAAPAGLPVARDPSDTARRHWKARCKEPGFIEAWPTVCANLAASTFARQGNWASFGWAIKSPDNWRKARDGQYADRPSQRPPTRTVEQIDAEIAAIRERAYPDPIIGEARKRLERLIAERDGVAAAATGSVLVRTG